MKHHATPAFWSAYGDLPPDVKRVADRCFALLKADPLHPSLHFKRVGRLWAVRTGPHHRALGVAIDAGVLWFWIGSHAQYDKLITD
ncbi:MAG: hypothetical protein JSS41_10155 [Proteobacteria bacterium]|nr:hypothetical protein [Pseudomonadota bacterium]